jgi:hypothetical protein
MGHTNPMHESIGQSGIHIDLEQNGHRDQHHMNGLAHDVLGLEVKDEDQGEEQGCDGDWDKSR